MKAFRFHNPTVLYYGAGQIEAHLAAEVRKYGSRVLLVYGGGSIKRFGLYDKVTGILKNAGCTVFELPGVEPNPRLSSVRRGIDICRNENIELILAVGGGSVLDAAKAIAAGAKYNGDVWDFYTKRAVVQDALPLGTILTLAATGSEMNGNSVITNWETKDKLSTGSPHLYPKFSFCDPANTVTVPRDQTVYGIVDMISHVFEQYFSPTPHTPLQDRLCEAVMRTIVEHAPRVLEQPDSLEARETMMYCSTMALNGMISMGMEGDWATHNIEHEISAIYDIPHGGGLAIVFPRWMEYVVDAGVEKFYQMAVRVFDVDPAGKTKRDVALEGIGRVKTFFRSIGAPSSLADYGIGGENIPVMAEKAVRFGPIGRFKVLHKEDVERILSACL
ncbi:MAG: NADH-dependent alcohol dehydrogenase [Candidatus Reconcilbacillus cellulovorans]|uniref:NADH-dependent alcohol dehydrogenase n=1 Tax=Candidatus Reconcilbacillus cellulovorans TaxID=1906605 RepID=A0A2A6DZG7_9BACL|nr:MAG: NADH-dependent alcohol dehydrogenase [Candidatus Reconcilbacillus cellulovorans]